MTLNEYFYKALATNKDTSDNITYSVMGLTAEVGEIADKIAKWRRKGIVSIDGNKLVFSTADEAEVAYYRQELAKELGDVLWFCAHLSRQLGYELEDVAQLNIAKLRDRAMRGVIDGNGDNR